MGELGIGAWGNGPCAKDVGQVMRMERSVTTAALIRFEDLPRAIMAG